MHGRRSARPRSLGSNVDRDMLAARVEGLANEALADDPAMLARLLG
jgi:hypothetical protein